MSGYLDHEEQPLLLVRRAAPRRRTEAEDPDLAEKHQDLPPVSARPRGRALEAYDRMGPAMAGSLMGLLAGAAGFGVVHGMELARIERGVAAAAGQWDVTRVVALVIAYATAAAIGGLVGACFASVTRHLRRFFPLVLWALVFFASLTLLVLAAARTYGSGTVAAMTPAILVASLAYALVASFQLPLRRRAPR